MSIDEGLAPQLSAHPVPKARTVGILTSETGEEVVLHDDENHAYHALSRPTFVVWSLCNGVNTPETITRLAASSGVNLAPEATALAIAELGEAGLLEAPQDGWGARLQRRRVVKLAAAGLLGGALFPAIASITSPDSAAAVSPGVCPAPLGRRLGQSCTYSCQCNSPLCCKLGICTTNIVPAIPCAPLLP